MLSRGLRSRVRTIRFEWRAFCEERSIVFRQAAHDFVSRDLHEAFDATFTCSIEQNLRAIDVGLQKLRGVRDATVHMRLGGEIYDRIHVFAERIHDCVAVTDVRVYKLMA